MGFAWTSADVYYFTAFDGPPPQPVTGIQAVPLPRPAPHGGPRSGRRPAARHRRPARVPAHVSLSLRVSAGPEPGYGPLPGPAVKADYAGVRVINPFR